MEKTDNKTKGTKLPLGAALIAAVAIVTIVILIVCRGILFPQEYSSSSAMCCYYSMTQLR